jgi:hypothetical protein
MGDLIDTAKVYALANEMMFSGKQISVPAIADAMDIEASDELTSKLEHWWMEQESRVTFRHSMNSRHRPDVPETVINQYN